AATSSPGAVRGARRPTRTTSSTPHRATSTGSRTSRATSTWRSGGHAVDDGLVALPLAERGGDELTSARRHCRVRALRRRLRMSTLGGPIRHPQAGGNEKAGRRMKAVAYGQRAPGSRRASAPSPLRLARAGRPDLVLIAT